MRKRLRCSRSSWPAEIKHRVSIAYQIAFDLYDNGTQEFLGKVRDALPEEKQEVAGKYRAGIFRKPTLSITCFDADWN